MQVVIEMSSGDHMQLHVNNVCLLWYNDKFTCNVDFVWYNSALKSRNKETAFAALETIKRHQMNPYESLFTTTFSVAMITKTFLLNVELSDGQS